MRGISVMTQHGTWVAYGGTARLALAGVLVVAAAASVYAGARLPLPASLVRPGRKAAVTMVVAWILSIILVLVGFTVYVLQAVHDHLTQAAAQDPITAITVIAAGITFFVIVVASPHGGWTAITSGVIAGCAAVMIFELPFDIIVMARTYPPLPPNPALYRVIFFAPLFLVELTTLSLLTLSPMVKLARSTFYGFALMLAVFAAWALTGYGYPLSPVPFAFNTVSKILAFVTVLTMFLPQHLATHAEESGAEQKQPHASR